MFSKQGNIKAWTSTKWEHKNADMSEYIPTQYDHMNIKRSKKRKVTSAADGLHTTVILAP